MPSRNVLKIDIPENYYHVYARDASRKAIFSMMRTFAIFLAFFIDIFSSTAIPR